MCFNIQPSAMSTPTCGLSNGNVTLISVAQKLLIPLGSPSGLEITAAIRDGRVPKYVDSGESGVVEPWTVGFGAEFSREGRRERDR